MRIKDILIELTEEINFISFDDLPSGVQPEGSDYFSETGSDPREADYEMGVMTSEGDIDYWLQNKISMEGKPEDEELMNQICRDGEVKEPVILDVSTEYTVEGRHRLAAAKRCGLDVPVVAIIRPMG